MTKKIQTKDPNQGKRLNIAGGEYRIITSGKDTNGEYAIIEMNVPAGAGPVPHAHPDFEEIFHVVDGELTFRSDDATFLAQKGATVTIPKGGGAHNFKNHTDKPAKMLCTVIPAGLDAFFEEAHEIMNSNHEEGFDLKSAIQAISEKYGQTLFSPDYWE